MRKSVSSACRSEYAPIDSPAVAEDSNPCRYTAGTRDCSAPLSNMGLGAIGCGPRRPLDSRLTTRVPCPAIQMIWGKYESSFASSEPESYRRDVPNAEVPIVDGGISRWTRQMILELNSFSETDLWPGMIPGPARDIHPKSESKSFILNCFLVELVGIEPTTSSLRTMRSPS